MSEARRLTLALRGRWAGRYGVARCPAHDDHTPSLTLTDAPDGRLLARCHAGCQFTDVIDALRGRGLAEGRRAVAPPDPAVIARQRAADDAADARRERAALALWREAAPVAGTPAETWLRGRGVTCALPGALRYSRACRHPGGGRHPAMLALIEGGARSAVHRTYLRTDGRAKADVDPARAMLGGAMGGAVRLTRGDGPLIVAEGVETALALASGLYDGPARIWAALSASGMAGLRLPDAPGALIVATDGDETGRAAGDRLAARAAATGWDVSLLPAPDGRDWNDMLPVMEGAA